MNIDEFRGKLLAVLHAPGGEDVAKLIVRKSGLIEQLIDPANKKILEITMVMLLKGPRRKDEALEDLMARGAMASGMLEDLGVGLSAAAREEGVGDLDPDKRAEAVKIFALMGVDL